MAPLLYAISTLDCSIFILYQYKIQFICTHNNNKNVLYILNYEEFMFLPQCFENLRQIHFKKRKVHYQLSSFLSVKFSLELRKCNKHQCEFLYILEHFSPQKEVAAWGTFHKHQPSFCGENVLPWSFLSSYMDLTKLYYMWACALTWSRRRYTHAQMCSNRNTLIISHRTLQLLMAVFPNFLHWDYTVMCYISKCMVLPEIYTWILHLINNYVIAMFKTSFMQ
jgi:hypothetical protein